MNYDENESVDQKNKPTMSVKQCSFSSSHDEPNEHCLIFAVCLFSSSDEIFI